MSTLMRTSVTRRDSASCATNPSAKRIRALLGGQTVLDTTSAVLVWEPRRLVALVRRSGRATSAGPWIPSRPPTRPAPMPACRCPTSRGAPCSTRRCRSRRTRTPGTVVDVQRRWTAPAAAPGCCPTIPISPGYVVLDFARLRRVVRGGRAQRRPSPRPVQADRRAGQLRGRCRVSIDGRCWRSRAGPGSCTRRSSRRGSTCPGRTSEWSCCPARPGRCAPTRGRRPTGPPCSSGDPRPRPGVELSASRCTTPQQVQD